MTIAGGADSEALLAELERLIEGDVHFDRYSRAMYSTDASIYLMEPVGVVIPRHQEDVAEVVRTAYRYDVPVLPRGGGTSLSGQCVNHAIVLDFSKYMNQVLEVSPTEKWARVQPGITLDELNHQLLSHGLQYAPDPATSNRATVGGTIGNNSCGTHSVIYGKTVDHVRALDLVLANGDLASTHLFEWEDPEASTDASTLERRIYGEVRRIAQSNRTEVLRRFPKVMRRVGGYNLDACADDGPLDLTKLLVGSEGTLATVTGARVNLVPVPRMKGLAVAHFKSMRHAMEATVAILEHSPSAIELLGRMLLQLTRQSVGFARRLTFLEGDPEAALLVEFYGDTEGEVVGKLEALQQDLEQRRLSYATVTITDPGEQANVWAVRKAGLGLLMSVKGDTKPLPFVEDTAVDPSRLPEYIDRFDEIVRSQGTTAGYYGHASVGCIHIRPMVNLKEQLGLDTMVAISGQVADLVQEFGGSLSGEHGDGIVRGVWNEKMFGPQLYNAFREIKHAFDPKNIMNPGKIVDCPPMTENLRIGPRYETFSPETYFDFSGDGGFARSVELCSGLGACRKMLGGTMCPSYMATRDEVHSTRGRANALRAVLSGLLPSEELTSKRLYDVMDLCIGCKGCKAECPSQVDMAKMKYEILTRYYEVHGLPLRARLFSNIAAISKLGSILSPLSNWASRNLLVRWAMDRCLGIDRRRPLPAFARTTFPRWFRHYQKSSNQLSKTGGQVVLFNDTFMDYNYPQVGQAATRLLEAAGFEVVLVDKRCCGRPMISNGMMPKARANARYNVNLLYEYAAKGIPIVGCEPSCLLTLRDEYPDLLRDEKSQIVARHAFMIEEFLNKLAGEGAVSFRFRNTPRRILFHGHCHQKALIGAEPAISALRLVPGYHVELVNSGCCGMAGSFGFEREHYGISRAIGAQRLFPAIQAPDKTDWEVAISGASCRQQIEQFTLRPARHIVELMAEALL